MPDKPVGSKLSEPVRIFISHSSADDEFCGLLVRDLRRMYGGDRQEDGNEAIWYDSRGGLYGGDVWWNRITRELTLRPVFVIVLSPDSMKSKWVQDELAMAWKQKNSAHGSKTIIPVLYRPCLVPEYLNLVQFVSFVPPRSYESAFAELLNAIRLATTRLKDPTPLTPEGPPADASVLPRSAHFVGRVTELDALMKRLRSGGVTSITALNGLGGIGKTALAAEAAARLQAEGVFHDGIAVVSCNGRSDPAEVLRAALARFDAQRRLPDTDSLPDLAKMTHSLLDGKRALIVLDNVEPALAARLSDVVRPLSAAGAAVLVTARELLPVDAVPVEGRFRLRLLESDEALSLFVRSCGYDDLSRVADADREQALRIVETLDRHTLAVKLAGTYLADTGRPLKQFADELESDPLKAPDGDTPRAVALALERSVTPLPENALSLFVGLAAIPTLEFSREAALALASEVDDAAPDGLIDLLIRRSLLEASTIPLHGGAVLERLRMHPLVHALAMQKFGELSDEIQETVPRVFVSHYVQYCGEHYLRRELLLPDQRNFTGMMDWAHERGRDSEAVWIAYLLAYVWKAQGFASSIVKYLPWAIAHFESQLNEPADKLTDAPLLPDWSDTANRLFDVLSVYADALGAVGRRIEAFRTSSRAVRLTRELSAPQGLRARATSEFLLHFAGMLTRGSLTLNNLWASITASGLSGVSPEQLGMDSSGADELIRQALADPGLLNDMALLREILPDGSVADTNPMEYFTHELDHFLAYYAPLTDNLDDEMAALYRKGLLALTEGRPSEATAHFLRLLDTFRESGDMDGADIILSMLGTIAKTVEDFAAAESYFEEAVALRREQQIEDGQGEDLRELARLASRAGRMTRARDLYEESLASFAVVEAHPVYADTAFEFGRFLITECADPQAGCAKLQEAIRWYETLQHSRLDEAIAESLRLGCTVSASREVSQGSITPPAE